MNDYNLYLKTSKPFNSIQINYSFEFNNSILFPFGGFDEFKLHNLDEKNIRLMSKILLKEVVLFNEHNDTSLFYRRNMSSLNSLFSTTNQKSLSIFGNINGFGASYNEKIFKSSTNLIFKQWKKLIDKYNINDIYTDNFFKIQSEILNNVNNLKNKLLIVEKILLKVTKPEFKNNEFDFKKLINEVQNNLEAVNLITDKKNDPDYLKIESNLKELHKLTLTIKKDISSKYKILNTTAEDYIELKEKINEKENSNIVDFIESVNENNISCHIKLSKSQKYEEIIFFHNQQFIVKDNKGNYIEPNNSKDAKQIIKDFNIDIINFELRKNPTLSKIIITKYKEEENLEKTFILLNSLKQNQQILKNINYTIDINSSIEAITDSIAHSVKKHKIEKLSMSIMSNKYKRLYSQDCFPIFEQMIESNFTEKQVQEFVGKKIASCKTQEDFLTYLTKIKNTIFNFSSEKLLVDVDKCKSVKLINSENDLYILKVDTFDDSKILGTSNWCISRESYYFDTYANGNNQYFLYDFSKDSYHPESMIGITLYKDGSINAAHDKKDDNIKKDELIKELSKKIIINDIESFPDIESNPEYKNILVENIKNKSKIKVSHI